MLKFFLLMLTRLCVWLQLGPHQWRFGVDAGSLCGYARCAASNNPQRPVTARTAAACCDADGVSCKHRFTLGSRTVKEVR
jgi:hypothetical protein